MPTTVRVNLTSAQEIAIKRGLDPHGRVQKLLTGEIYKKTEPYTPYQNGELVRSAEPLGDNYILYNSPYARFLYYGKVMVGEKSNSPWARSDEQKIVTGRDLTYQGAPQRGKDWINRMWSDRGSEIMDTIAKASGGHPE